ncbi:MAG: hypothetical protein FWD61_18995 [Phycisphaerales bacterium]|nr:hypothetical protein [Phycisphaerales bacterium]
MSSQTVSPSSASVIHELQHAAKQYRVITTDEEILQQSGEQIVRACKLQMNASRWHQNFNLMVEHVREWCKERANQIAFALVELRSDKTVFFVIPRSEQYDFDLGLEQARLDIYLSTRGGIGYTETRQVPGWEVDRFVGQQAFLIYPMSDSDGGNKG